MNLDITSALENWPFHYDGVSARRILGDDGKHKVQLRLDLGLLQMEMDGRPDGRRPQGKESYLEYHLERQRAYKDAKGTAEGFALTGEECEELRREAMQYYHRYVAFSTLNDYDRLIRDTTRNLQLADLFWNHAPGDDRWSLEPFRPYLIMMNTRGKAMQSLEVQDYTAALLQIRTGIRLLEDFFRKHGREELIPHCDEIKSLRKWAGEIDEKREPTLKEKLEKQLAEAVHEENYERAARLRDRLRTWEMGNIA